MPIPQVTDRIKEAPAVALRAVFAGIGQLLMAVDKIRAQMQEQATSSAAPAQERPSAAQPPQGQADGASNVTVLRERATAPTKPGGTKPGAVTKPAATKAAAGARPAAGPKPAAGAKLSAEEKPAAGTKPGADAAKPAKAKPATATVKPAAKPAAAAETKPGPGATKPSASAKPASASAAAREPAAAKPAPVAAAVPAAPIPGYDDLSVASLRARLRGLDAAGVQALLDYEKANARRDDVITMFERRLSKIENGTS
jgi:hypothetical protein